MPLRQLYAKSVRKEHSPNLLTIQVHADCNASYQHDEDYFVNTLAPLAYQTYGGRAFLQDVFAKYKAGEKQKLVAKVLNEFQHRPSGIILPKGLVAKRFEGERLSRVAWKIVRGLYFHETGDVLPEHTPHNVEIVAPDQPPPKAFLLALSNLPSKGRHPGIFDYKYTQGAEVHDFNYWGLLLWGRVILIVMFHNPACTCEHCVDLRGRASDL